MCKLLAGRQVGAEAEPERRIDGRRLSMGGVRRKDGEVKVGVFFCGPPVIGVQIADRCRQLTARGRQEGRRVEYRFMMEVFG